MGAIIFWGVIGTVLLVLWARCRWMRSKRLPHDLRQVGVEGLPSDASIRSGELGRGPAYGEIGRFGGGGGPVG